MAQLTVTETGEVVTDAGRIKQMLADHGVTFERWGTSHLPACVAEKASLATEDKESVLGALQGQLADLIARKGYKTADIVVLSPETPNLEGLLNTFRKEHYHTEDEVRFVVDGEGVFSIRGRDDRMYDVLVQVGDLLIVPAGCWHWFGLTHSHRIKCVRVFQTTEGWQALFREEATV